jgi:phosphopantetheinyl transferase
VCLLKSTAHFSPQIWVDTFAPLEVRAQTHQHRIAQALQCSAEAVHLTSNSLRAPSVRIDAPYAAFNPLFISRAKRDPYTLYALACTPIAVDIEAVSPAISAPFDLPFDILHPQEQAFLHTLADAEKAKCFAQIWTLKEAYIKLLGTGWHIPPDAFSVVTRSMPPVQCATLSSKGELSLAKPAENFEVHSTDIHTKHIPQQKMWTQSYQLQSAHKTYVISYILFENPPKII